MSHPTGKTNLLPSFDDGKKKKIPKENELLCSTLSNEDTHQTNSLIATSEEEIYLISYTVLSHLFCLCYNIMCDSKRVST